LKKSDEIKDDAQHMAEVLRSGIVEKKLEARLSGEVEYDEVDMVAGQIMCQPAFPGQSLLTRGKKLTKNLDSQKLPSSSWLFDLG